MTFMAVLCGIGLLLITLGPSVTQAAEAGAFPVAIRHALGETMIAAEPQRIVTLGWNGEDSALALGRIPVGIARYDLFKSGRPPWVEERLNGKEPVLLDQAQIDFEAIAALKPDVILAIRSGVNAQDYKRLSSIAPTVVYRSGPWIAGWREQTELIGLALGQPRKAAELIARTEATLRNAMLLHPVLQQKSFIFGSYFPGEGELGIYLPIDPRVSFLVELGLEVAPSVEALAADNPGARGLGISLERLDTIDADLLIVWFGAGTRADAERQPLFRTFSPVVRGGYIPLEDPVWVWLTSAPSVLSIDYGLSDFLDLLAKAASKSAH